MAIKAKTRAAKRRLKGGRPLKANALRTDTGRLSRSNEVKESEVKLMLEAATWKRRQRLDKNGMPFIDETIPVEKVRGQEYGSVVHSWKAAHDLFRKKYGPDKIDRMSFTGQNLETAQEIQRSYENFRMAVASRNPRSSSDFSGPGGFDGRDPFDSDREKRDKWAMERWVGRDGKGGMRDAILKSGPMGMMAVEAIIFENKPMDSLIGDLRLALNAVERMGRISKAA